MTTYGRLSWIDDPRPAWIVQAQPHVTIRLKRIFPRADMTRAGLVALADTPETARELEWCMDRWPLEMEPDVARRLLRSADAHREQEQAVNDILGGKAGVLRLDLGEPGMTPRPYQEQFVALLAEVRRILLGDATGVGKTITSGLALGLPHALPALVAMPTHLPAQWTARLHQLWPTLRVHTLQGTHPYDLLARCKGQYPDVLLAPYSRLSGWAPAVAGQVRTVIFDEVQDLRRGTETYKGRAAATIAGAATYVVGQSATPAHNYGGEFWNILDIINPGALGTRSEFLREWCGDTWDDGKPAVRNPRAFGTYLRTQGLMIARSRADVGQELPNAPVIEVETVGADKDALDSAAAEISELARMILDDGAHRQDRWVAGGQIDMKLRQATGVAKAPHVAAYVRLLLESEAKVVLYGWHRAVYDIWLRKLADFNPVLYTGTESPAQKGRAAEAFMKPNSDPDASRVLIISLASGSGLDGLQDVCSTVVFGELDWSPKVHTQAVDRIDRPGQTSPVLVVYLVAEDGSDPVIAEVLDLKSQNIDPIMDPELPLVERKRSADPGASRMRGLAKAWLERQA
jgi:hypothetical protein